MFDAPVELWLTGARGKNLRHGRAENTAVGMRRQVGFPLGRLLPVEGCSACQSDRLDMALDDNQVPAEGQQPVKRVRAHKIYAELMLFA